MTDFGAERDGADDHLLDSGAQLNQASEPRRCGPAGALARN